MSSEQRHQRLGLGHLTGEAYTAALAKLVAEHEAAVNRHLSSKKSTGKPMSDFSDIQDEEPIKRSQDHAPLPQPVVAKAKETIAPAKPARTAAASSSAAQPKSPVAPAEKVAPETAKTSSQTNQEEMVEAQAQKREAARSSLSALHLQLGGGARSVGGSGKSGATTRPPSAGITSRSAGQRAAGSSDKASDTKASDTFAQRMDQLGVLGEVAQLMSGLHKLPEPMRLLVMRGLQDAQSGDEIRDIVAQTQPLLG